MALCAVAFLACASALETVRAPFARPEPVPDPLLWRADHPERGTLYLLGSVHLGDRRIDDLGPAVDAAWQGSDELVVEINTADLSPETSQALVLEYAALPPPQTVPDVIPADVWQKLVDHLRSRGIPEATVQHWKPWFVYLVLAQIEFERAGYRAEHGVDALFIRSADGEKPIVALESMELQFDIFDALPMSLQAQLLEDALVEADGVSLEVAALVDAWTRGDEQRLTELVFDPLSKKPELEIFYDRVFFERNRTMTAGLDELSRDGKTRFVVVGAGHMLAEQGIPALLGERGWSVVSLGGQPDPVPVTRVQQDAQRP